MFCDLDLKGSDVSFDGEQESMEKMNGIIIQADQSRLKAAKKVFVLKDSQYLTISKLPPVKMAARKHSINMIHGNKKSKAGIGQVKLKSPLTAFAYIWTNCLLKS